MKKIVITLLTGLALLGACKKKEPTPVVTPPVTNNNNNNNNNNTPQVAPNSFVLDGDVYDSSSTPFKQYFNKNLINLYNPVPSDPTTNSYNTSTGDLAIL